VIALAVAACVHARPPAQAAVSLDPASSSAWASRALLATARGDAAEADRSWSWVVRLDGAGDAQALHDEHGPHVSLAGPDAASLDGATWVAPFACARPPIQVPEGPAPARIGRARGRIEIESASGSSSAPVALVLDRPERASLALLTPVGTPAWTLTTSGPLAWVRDVRAHRQYLSMESDVVLRDTLGLDATTLWALLVGDPSVLPAVHEPGPVDGTALGTLPLADGRSVRVLAESGDGRPVRLVVLDATGTPRAAAHYGPFRTWDDTALPETVDLDLPDLDLTLRIAFASWEAREPDPALFDATPPDGFGLSSLTDLGDLIPR
jgi:hypothetical protein